MRKVREKERGGGWLPLSSDRNSGRSLLEGLIMIVTRQISVKRSHLWCVDGRLHSEEGLAKGFAFAKFQHQVDFDRLLEKNLGI